LKWGQKSLRPRAPRRESGRDANGGRPEDQKKGSQSQRAPGTSLPSPPQLFPGTREGNLHPKPVEKPAPHHSGPAPQNESSGHSKLRQRTVQVPRPLGLKLHRPHPRPSTQVQGRRNFGGGVLCPPWAAMRTYPRAIRTRQERSGVPDVRGLRAAGMRRWRRSRGGVRSSGARSPRSARAPTRL
jgi:hypothetical protein